MTSGDYDSLAQTGKGFKIRGKPFPKGHKPWNTGKKGYHIHSLEWKEKLRQRLEGKPFPFFIRKKKGKYVKCQRCGKSFCIKPCKLKSVKYCSWKCKTNQIWKICPICKKKFQSCMSNNRECCSKKCKNLHHIDKIGGDKHPNWKGGSSFKPYPLGWNKTFKEQIRYRDNYKCQMCGMPEIENNRKLNIHHKDFDKSNLELDNLISFCNSCHGKANRGNNGILRFISEHK